MRILLDESLPSELRQELPGHEVQMVQDAGWSGLANGELLRRAAGPIEREPLERLSSLPARTLIRIGD
jgi:hypothetical protein